MVEIPPIPLELLIHNVEYFPYDASSSWGESWGAAIPLLFVRVEPETKLVKNANGDQVVSSNLLFVDTANSEPSPLPAFTEKSKVRFNDRDYFIVSVATLYAYDPQTPHHYEISLQ